MRFYSHVVYWIFSVIALFLHEINAITSESLFFICSFLMMLILIFEINATEKKRKTLGKQLIELKRNYIQHGRPVQSFIYATLIFILGIFVINTEHTGPDTVFLSWFGLNALYGIYAGLILGRIRVMENGIVHHNGILSWNDIRSFEWFATPRSKKKSYSKLRLVNKPGTLFDEVMLEIADLEKPIIKEILNTHLIGETNQERQV